MVRCRLLTRYLTGCSSKPLLWAATVTVGLHFSEAVVEFTEAAAAHLSLCTATLSQQDRAPVGSVACPAETRVRLFLSSVVILHWADHDLAGGAPGISHNYMAAPKALRCGCRAFTVLSQVCDSTSLARINNLQATQHQHQQQQQEQQPPPRMPLPLQAPPPHQQQQPQQQCHHLLQDSSWLPLQLNLLLLLLQPVV